ncbi:hypothetical protein CBL_12618 [Carabus blaptoides fortunei]
MDDIIKKHLPESWYTMRAGIECYTWALNKDTDKYKKLYDLMQGPYLKEITGMYEVQNPILYEQFQLKVTECRLDTNVTVQELLHCTSVGNVLSILENNFDWRLCHRVKYGRGVSFSTDPGYAHLQSSLKNGKRRAMIVADVIIGRTQLGNRHTIIPNEPYDTTVDSDGNVFVKYCDYDFYPKYVVYFEGHKVVSQNGQRSLLI